MTNNTPGFSIDAKQELVSKLTKLEKERKKAFLDMFIIWFVVLISILIFIYLFWKSDSQDEQNSKRGIVISLVLLAIILSLWKRKRIIVLFKEKVISTILNHLLPEIQHTYYQKLTPSNVRGTRLFKRKANRTSGEDFFKGTRGLTEFKLSELKAKFKTVIPIGGIFRPDRLNVKLFKGVLIMCRLETPLNKSVRIYSKGVRGISVPKNMERKPITHKEFDKFFKIYSYPEEDILSVTHNHFLERLISIKEAFNSDIYISIFPKSANVAIRTNTNFFDPQLNKKIDLKQVERIYQEIINCLMVVDVIDELNINKEDAEWRKKIDNVKKLTS